MIIKARFLRDGEPSGKEYSYLAEEDICVGDTVIAKSFHGTDAKLVVTQVDIPEEEIAKFADKIKTVKKEDVPLDAPFVPGV